MKTAEEHSMKKIFEEDVIEMFNLPDLHCTSCHEDADEYGMDLVYIEVNGQDVEVCCDVVDNFKKKVSQ